MPRRWARCSRASCARRCEAASTRPRRSGCRPHPQPRAPDGCMTAAAAGPGMLEECWSQRAQRGRLGANPVGRKLARDRRGGVPRAADRRSGRRAQRRAHARAAGAEARDAPGAGDGAGCRGGCDTARAARHARHRPRAPSPPGGATSRRPTLPVATRSAALVIYVTVHAASLERARRGDGAGRARRGARRARAARARRRAGARARLFAARSLRGPRVRRFRPHHVASTAPLGLAHPFLCGEGLGQRGLVVGTDQAGGLVCFDPFELYASGAIAGPGIAVMGEIGRGKSSLVKSLVLRQVGTLGTARRDHQPQARRVRRARGRTRHHHDPPRRRLGCSPQPARGDQPDRPSARGAKRRPRRARARVVAGRGRGARRRTDIPRGRRDAAGARRDAALARPAGARGRAGATPSSGRARRASSHSDSTASPAVTRPASSTRRRAASRSTPRWSCSTSRRSRSAPRPRS